MNSINMFKSKIIAVVPAAGVGKRMLLDCPKQYVKVANRTIIEHTLTTLLLHPSIFKIVVSLHHQDNYFHKLPISSNPRIVSVIGGKKRMHSVLSGLMVVQDADWVIVHDAARPCLSYQDLEKLISIIKKNASGGILARPLSDTIKVSNIKKKFYPL